MRRLLGLVLLAVAIAATTGCGVTEKPFSPATQTVTSEPATPAPPPSPSTSGTELGVDEPQASPTPTPTQALIDPIESWADVVDAAGNGRVLVLEDGTEVRFADLEAKISEHKSALGFNWADVERWGSLRVDEKTHKEAIDGVPAKSVVKVIFVDSQEEGALTATSCTALTGSCPDGDGLVLFPLIEQEGTWRLGIHAMESGLALGDLSLLAIGVANTG